MTLEAIATLIGVSIGWFFLTIRPRDDDKPIINRAKRNRRARHTETNGLGNDDIRQSVEAVLATAQVSERLLDRLDKIEKNQEDEQQKREKAESAIAEKVDKMAEKISFLTEQNNEKTRKIKRLQKEVRVLKNLLTKQGYKVTTDELTRLVAELPEEDEQESDKP